MTPNPCHAANHARSLATAPSCRRWLLGTAMMGLPGLSVPTGLADGLPVGVQICTARFREDVALRAGEVIERAARFSALDVLANESCED